MIYECSQPSNQFLIHLFPAIHPGIKPAIPLAMVLFNQSSFQPRNYSSSQSIIEGTIHPSTQPLIKRPAIQPSRNQAYPSLIGPSIYRSIILIIHSISHTSIKPPIHLAMNPSNQTSIQPKNQPSSLSIIDWPIHPSTQPLFKIRPSDHPAIKSIFH